MRRVFLVPLLFMFGGMAFGQTVPTCNNFDANGVPVFTSGLTTSYNCTDYFGVGNWANSPLPAGTITGFTLIAGGSGYANPVVVITDPTGSGASATATATAGVITAITGSGGT
ncbi:MAG: hypothetical protein ACM3JH_14385, partial [Acidithiobacillales bacterium]